VVVHGVPPPPRRAGTAVSFGYDSGHIGGVARDVAAHACAWHGACREQSGNVYLPQRGPGRIFEIQEITRRRGIGEALTAQQILPVRCTIDDLRGGKGVDGVDVSGVPVLPILRQRSVPRYYVRCTS
jgi:hypothetical protein